MKDSIVVTAAIVAMMIGYFIHMGIFPQNPVVETEVEVYVDRIIEVPTEKENYYTSCRRAADNTYISNWDGDIKDGVTPRDIEKFIKQCLDYYKN